MNPTSPVVGQAKHPSDIGFPLFSAGQLLRHDDLTGLADYTREITRLLMRSLFGCGVVCGLCVKPKIVCHKLTVEVACGVALDCDGDPIHVPKTTTITVDPKCDPLNGPLWVILRGIDKCCAPRATVCSSDEDEVPSACTREQYWYEIQVVSELPECVCGCMKPTSSYGGHPATPSGDTVDVAVAAPAPYVDTDPCQCVHPDDPCYADHYAGKCTCACPGCTYCECEWVLLARLDKTTDPDPEKAWAVDYDGRRVVRPVLMRDQQCGQKPVAKQAAAEELTGSDIPKAARRGARATKPGTSATS